MKWYFLVPLSIVIASTIILWIGIFWGDYPRIRRIGILPWLKLITIGDGEAFKKCLIEGCNSSHDPRCRGKLCSAHCGSYCHRQCIVDDQRAVKDFLDTAPIADRFIKPPPIGRKIQNN